MIVFNNAKSAIRILGLILLLFVYSNTQAQHILGIGISNWSGTNCLYFNPANIADSRQKVAIDLFSFNTGFDNNLGTINNADGNAIDITAKKTFSLLAPYLEIRGPSLMISNNHKFGFAFTSRVRAMNQYNNFNMALYNTIETPGLNKNGNFDLNTSNFNYTAHIWKEFAFTLGILCVETPDYQVKGGITLRYLGGMGYLGVKSKNIDIHYYSGLDSLKATNSDLEYSSNIFNSDNSLSSSPFGNFGSNAGSGLGGDIGVVYECIQNTDYEKADERLGRSGVNYSRPRFKLRLSAAIVDMGHITYKGTNGNYSVKVTGNGGFSSQSLMDNLDAITNFSDFAKTRGFAMTMGPTDTKVYLPTTSILGCDYNIYKHLYINGTAIINLRNLTDFGNCYYSQLVLVPRYDSRILSFAMPITYSMLAHDFKMGFGIRFGGFFIGGDDLRVLYAKSQYGASAYFGFFIPINKHS